MNNKTSEKAPGAEWCHVGYGQLSGNQLILQWADVPVGTDELYGTVTIEVVSETEMKVVEDSGSFGKSVWHWHMPQKNFNALTGE